MVKAVIISGAPGSGKGTIAEYLHSKFGLVHLSTGEELRKEINKNTDLGKEIKRLLSDGKFVSDDLIYKIVDSFIKENKLCKGIIFDGYPRSLDQVKGFDDLVKENRMELSCIIYLHVSEKDAIERISHRLVHLPSGRTYNTITNPPKHEGLDDITNEPLVRREDDKPEIVARRYQDFLKITEPVLDYFNPSEKPNSRFFNINTSHTLTDIYSEVEEIIKRVELTI